MMHLPGQACRPISPTFPPLPSPHPPTPLAIALSSKFVFFTLVTFVVAVAYFVVVACQTLAAFFFPACFCHYYISYFYALQHATATPLPAPSLADSIWLQLVCFPPAPPPAAAADAVFFQIHYSHLFVRFYFALVWNFTRFPLPLLAARFPLTVSHFPLANKANT